MIPIIDSILGIVKKVVPDSNAAMNLAKDLESEYTKQMSMQHQIIMAEMKSGSGKWRPRLMYLCMFFVTAHFVMYDLLPYLAVAFDWQNIILTDGPNNEHFWSFLKIGVGGYIGGRSAEKITAWFKR